MEAPPINITAKMKQSEVNPSEFHGSGRSSPNYTFNCKTNCSAPFGLAEGYHKELAISRAIMAESDEEDLLSQILGPVPYNEMDEENDFFADEAPSPTFKRQDSATPAKPEKTLVLGSSPGQNCAKTQHPTENRASALPLGAVFDSATGLSWHIPNPVPGLPPLRRGILSPHRPESQPAPLQSPFIQFALQGGNAPNAGPGRAEYYRLLQENSEPMRKKEELEIQGIQRKRKRDEEERQTREIVCERNKEIAQATESHPFKTLNKHHQAVPAQGSATKNRDENSKPLSEAHERVLDKNKQKDKQVVVNKSARTDEVSSISKRVIAAPTSRLDDLQLAHRVGARLLAESKRLYDNFKTLEAEHLRLGLPPPVNPFRESQYKPAKAHVYPSSKTPTEVLTPRLGEKVKTTKTNSPSSKDLVIKKNQRPILKLNIKMSDHATASNKEALMSAQKEVAPQPTNPTAVAKEFHPFTAPQNVPSTNAAMPNQRITAENNSGETVQTKDAQLTPVRTSWRDFPAEMTDQLSDFQKKMVDDMLTWNKDALKPVLSASTAPIMGGFPAQPSVQSAAATGVNPPAPLIESPGSALTKTLLEFQMTTPTKDTEMENSDLAGPSTIEKAANAGLAGASNIQKAGPTGRKRKPTAKKAEAAEFTHPAVAKKGVTKTKKKASNNKKKSRIPPGSAFFKKDSAGIKKDSSGIKKDSAGIKKDSAGVKKNSAGVKKKSADSKKKPAGTKKQETPTENQTPGPPLTYETMTLQQRAMIDQAMSIKKYNEDLAAGTQVGPYVIPPSAMENLMQGRMRASVGVVPNQHENRGQAAGPALGLPTLGTGRRGQMGGFGPGGPTTQRQYREQMGVMWEPQPNVPASNMRPPKDNTAFRMDDVDMKE